MRNRLLPKQPRHQSNPFQLMILQPFLQPFLNVSFVLCAYYPTNSAFYLQACASTRLLTYASTGLHAYLAYTPTWFTCLLAYRSTWPTRPVGLRPKWLTRLLGLRACWLTCISFNLRCTSTNITINQSPFFSLLIIAFNSYQTLQKCKI